MRGIRLDVQEIKTRITLISVGMHLILSLLTVYLHSLSGKMCG